MYNIYHLGILPDYHFKFLIADIKDVTVEVARRLNLQHSSLFLASKAMLGAFFIAGMVKEETTISLQLEGEGKIERILAYGDRKGRMRSYVKNASIKAKPNDVTSGIGKGILKVTRWNSESRIHQSMTEMQVIGFEANLIKYIDESEQLLTFLSMGIEENFASGVIFQALGDTPDDKKDKMLNKLSEINLYPQELFQNGIKNAINELEKALSTRFEILETGVPVFQCSCSIEKIKNVISTLGKQEAFSILEEQGKIEMTCEFCREQYVLDPEEVHLLFM